MYLVVVTADTNDADYITEVHEFDDERYLKIKPRLKRIVSALRKNNWKWPSGKFIDSDPVDMYENLLSLRDIGYAHTIIPYGEYGVHTVESLKVYKIKEIVSKSWIN